MNGGIGIDAPPPLVVKFGGSSFAQFPDDYERIGRYLADLHLEQGRPVIAVASAPPGATEALRERLNAVNADSSPRYAATAFSFPDTESAILLASAVERAGVDADALNSHQNGIVTDQTPLWSRVRSVDSATLTTATNQFGVVCLASGHAADPQGRFTWMGKNSGDLTALLVAAAVGAPTVEIYSDVDGVYSGDPRIIPAAQLLPEISVNAARLMASRGAAVLDRRALDVARTHSIDIVCRSNHPPYRHGTTVKRDVPVMRPIIAIDERSVVLRAADPPEADQTYLHLVDAGLSCMRIEIPGYDNCIAVTGGYTNVESMIVRDQLPVHVTKACLVSTVYAHHADDHIADTREQARELGLRLHHQYASHCA